MPGVGQRQGNNALRVHVCEPNNMVGRELRVYDARADQSRFDADLRDSKPDDNDKGDEDKCHIYGHSRCDAPRADEQRTEDESEYR